MVVAASQFNVTTTYSGRSPRHAQGDEGDAFPDLQRFAESGLGRTGLMLFAEFDLGDILRCETGSNTPKIMRFVVGNPLIMKEMVKHVPDAGSYAPVTIRPYWWRRGRSSEGNWVGFWGNEAVDQKLHDIGSSGPVVLEPDFSKLKVVGLTRDVAESY